MTPCVSLWVGERLGPVERACFRSVLRQGHGLTLYCYRVPEGVPDGVAVRDAAEVLGEDKLIRHRTGSVGLFSDWFRFELQRRGLGTWIDADVYFCRPLDGERPNLFGRLSASLINGAVLRLASNSPMLPELLRPFERQTTPDWMPLHWYLPAKLRELVRGKADLAAMPWGALGPFALTALARKYSLFTQADPPEVFYPVPWQKAGWIIDPAKSLEQMITSETVGVHLWNECIRDFKDKPPPAGSFLAQLHAEAR